MTVISRENFYGLYGHHGRGYNIIMTLDGNEFKYSEPGFSRSWSSKDFIPDEILKKYSSKEQKKLIEFWNSQGYFLQN